MSSDAPTASAHRPRKGKKYFTLEEANRALPYVRRIMDDIRGAYDEAVRLRGEMEQQEEPSEAQRERYQQVVERLNGLIEELQAMGTELKGFEQGLIDFPALHEGREILLCWQQGEERIDFWHEVDGGFAGRKPVSMLEHEYVEEAGEEG
jgi:hypothetical protein